MLCPAVSGHVRLVQHPQTDRHPSVVHPQDRRLTNLPLHSQMRQWKMPKQVPLHRHSIPVALRQAERHPQIKPGLVQLLPSIIRACLDLLGLQHAILPEQRTSSPLLQLLLLVMLLELANLSDGHACHHLPVLQVPWPVLH